MSAEQLNGPTPTEKVRSLWEKLVENPTEILTEINPNRTGFISTLRGKPLDRFSQVERTAAVRILFSSLSMDELASASLDLIESAALMGEDDDLPIHRAVENEINRRKGNC